MRSIPPYDQKNKKTSPPPSPGRNNVGYAPVQLLGQPPYSVNSGQYKSCHNSSGPASDNRVPATFQKPTPPNLWLMPSYLKVTDDNGEAHRGADKEEKTTENITTSAPIR